MVSTLPADRKCSRNIDSWSLGALTSVYWILSFKIKTQWLVVTKLYNIGNTFYNCLIGTEMFNYELRVDMSIETELELVTQTQSSSQSIKLSISGKEINSNKWGLVWLEYQL